MARKINKFHTILVVGAISVSVGYSQVYLSSPVAAEDRATIRAEEATEGASEKAREVNERALKAQQAASERREAREKAAEERRQATKERLSEDKLKACNERKDKITNRIVDISDRAVKHLSVFDNISDRAQAFYVQKGNELANYEALVANVEIKKASAQTAVEDLTARKDSFTCDGIDPKSTITTYKTSLETTRSALKEYRTAIKDLITGIKSVNPSTDDASAKSAEGAQ